MLTLLKWGNADGESHPLAWLYYSAKEKNVSPEFPWLLKPVGHQGVYSAATGSISLARTPSAAAGLLVSKKTQRHD